MFPAEAEWGEVGTDPGQRESSADCVVAEESEGLSASRTEGEAQPVSTTREQTSVVSSGRDGDFMRRLQFCAMLHCGSVDWGAEHKDSNKAGRRGRLADELPRNQGGVGIGQIRRVRPPVLLR
mgnify:FL=1